MKKIILIFLILTIIINFNAPTYAQNENYNTNSTGVGINIISLDFGNNKNFNIQFFKPELNVQATSSLSNIFIPILGSLAGAAAVVLAIIGIIYFQCLFDCSANGDGAYIGALLIYSPFLVIVGAVYGWQFAIKWFG